MANWKKIIVSGSDANLKTITGSKGLKLARAAAPLDEGLRGNVSVTPLVIDALGNVHTGSNYALAAGGGGDTVGGQNLQQNVAIVGNNNSAIKSASSDIDVSFNNADLTNITSLTASKAIFNTIALSGSYDGTGSSADLFTVSFVTESSADVIIPSTGIRSFDFKVPVTMSNVPEGTTETKVLLISSSGEVVTRNSSDIGGVNQVNGGTNLNVDSNTGNVTVNLDDSISLTNITASSNIFFTSSGAGPKNYRIDYAKVFSASSDVLVPSSGSLTITASGVQISGDLEASGSVLLQGALNFNGFNFTETSIGNITGSQTFGSGGLPQDLTHRFTGSVLITGSNLTLAGGVLTIANNAGDGTINVASALANAALSSNVTTNAVFNAFSQSYSQSVVDFLTTSTSLATQVNNFNSFSSSFSQSVTDFNTQVGIFQSFSSSFSQSVTDFVISSGALATQINNFSSFSSSFSSSIDNLTSFSQSIIAAITVDGTDTEFQNNVTVKGNLVVDGTTTTINAQDLSIEDRFIILGSGSATMDDDLDVGIIFDSGSQDGSGMALFYDNSLDRLSVGRNIHNVSHSIAADDSGGTAFNIGEGSRGEVAGQIVTVKANQTSAPSGSASSSFGEGEMYIHNGDIYIYID